MMDNYKETRFDIYCKTCEHFSKQGHEDPCNECLEYGMCEETEKPLNWKEKEGKHG